MTVQLNYTKNIFGAVAGLIYDIGNTNIDSFSAEEIIEYGTFVSRGANVQTQVQLAGAGSIGIAVRTTGENGYQLSSSKSVGEYKIGDTVGVLRSGFIWTQFDAAGGTVDAAVTINAQGRVVVAGTGTTLNVVKAIIEEPAVSILLEGSTVASFVGLVRITEIA